MRDVTVEYFFLIPIHGEGISKKNPSQWNINFFTYVCCLPNSVTVLVPITFFQTGIDLPRKNTTQNTTKQLTHTIQQDNPCHPYPSGFPLSPWTWTVHQCHSQIIALPIPSVHRSRATGLALDSDGSLAVDFKLHIENREREGVTWY
jgi:hypothetical protein